MTYRQARTLHNGDEVTLKRTGEITPVIDVLVDARTIWIRCMTREDGYSTIPHSAVR